MFCGKCGKELNEGQQFCTNCGKNVGTQKSAESNVEKNKAVEEKSAEIVSGVKETISNLAERGTKIVDKIKNDEKVNEAVNSAVSKVKSNKKTLSIIGAIVVSVLIVVLFACSLSGPKKAVKGYFSALRTKNFSKFSKYTGLEEDLLHSKLYEEVSNDAIFDIKDAKKEVEDEIEDLKDDFEDDFEDRNIKLKKIELVGKIDRVAACEVKYTITEDGDRETYNDIIWVNKIDGKWIVNDYIWGGAWR